MPTEGDVEELPFTVKFKKALIALHFLVIFGDGFGDDKGGKGVVVGPEIEFASSSMELQFL